MRKLKLTEEQAALLENYKKEVALLEAVEKTKGGQLVRNLIKEGTSIKGEVQNVYGKWYATEWNNEGKPLTSKNKFDEIVSSLKLNAD